MHQAVSKLFEASGLRGQYKLLGPNPFEVIRKHENCVGFAHFFLACKNKPLDEMDIHVYTYLKMADISMGVTVSEQLYSCLRKPVHFILTKVQRFFLTKEITLELSE